MSNALRDTVFVFRPADGLTEDEAYALLTDDASGVLLASAIPATHTGAMIALVPSPDDLARLAVEGGEPLEELHLTLAYLGEADLISEEMRSRIIDAAGEYLTDAVATEAFSVNAFNPHNPDMETALVLGVRGEDLVGPRSNIVSAVRGFFDMPANHEPWIPHVTLAYTDDIDRGAEFVGRLGPIKFDTLRFAFGGEVTDVPLYDDDPIEDGEPEIMTAAMDDECPDGYARLEDGTCANPDEEETLAEWEGVLTVEGKESGDGRMFSLGSLDWEAPPIKLMYQPANVGGHSGSVLVGQITGLARRNEQIYGWGIIDLKARYNGENIGKEVFRLMSEGFMNGVSVDVDKVKDADVQMVFGDGPKPKLTVFNRGRIRGATLVAFPAFTEASIRLTGDVLTASAIGEVLTMTEDCGCDAAVLTAASHTITIPDVPPAWWFSQPTDVEMKGAFTITDEGRVYGLLAPGGVTHRSVNRKVPRNVDYSRFMGKETIVSAVDGSTGRVRSGAITFNCGHASAKQEEYGTLDNRIKHYDNSCSVFADIAIGQDPRTDDVWIAGAVKSYATAEQISQAMSCTLSGDWQPHPDRPGVNEFVAALLVPVAGFAMARKEASVKFEDGALVASSIPVEFADSGLLTAAVRKKDIYRQRVGRVFDARRLELAQRIGRG